ncbi:phosphonate ABC transporter, permease protein PhnE [Actibacterium sp. 188UL27-1]|uniref:phosphonate ABC transporter, permease protein PhnE n=1 Tax=Actibacterium sp. 188UL27-1 TaxID=2786961 RepID=UPI00195D73F6|nr:phosphonate ABC transporter, permease protein PhnE [Actibacterium sp. 188UL27-1]MBM7066127.1 phosphonate ABC transporter, permease protein PhnE [Actibacterium sp. 188UL27-1]
MTAILPEHLTQLEVELKRLQRRKSSYTVVAIVITVAIFMVGVDMANSANATPFSQGFRKIFDFPIDMFKLSWELGFVKWANRVVEFLPDLILTLNMAVLSTFLGFVFAVVLACFASQNIMRSTVIVTFTRRMLDLFRSFPEIVIALIFLYLMGKSLLPAVIAITIHTTGALGKLFSEAIENIDTKPLEGLQSVGGSWVSRIRFGVFPQVMPIFFSYAILRLEINVRASTILGFFGAGGIGQALSNVIQWRDGGRVTAIFVLLVATIIALDYLSDWIRSRMIGRRT